MEDIEVKLKPLGSFDKPLRVYIPWAGRQSWIFKYRLSQPMDAGTKMKKVHYAVDLGEVHILDPSEETRTRALATSDCHLYHQYFHPRVFQMCMMEPRPAIILSTDDHLEWIEPFNPAFCHTGTKNLTGKDLTPGDEIKRVDHTGKHVSMWKDGETYIENGKPAVFDIAKNLQQIALLKGIARECDGVVASTEPLAKVYRDYGAKNVYVYPNSLDFSLYPRIEPAPHPQEVRILWTGGASHYIDLYTIKDPLRRVLDKHPQARMICFGQEFQVLEKWFGKQVEYIDWVDPDAYPYRLATIGHDINLCALRGTNFAECKSAIKFYESSAIWQPAATLGANFGPYQEIIDGETGFKYASPEEFEWKLSELIENETLRKSLAQNAQDWVHSYRNVLQTTPPYIDWLRETSEALRERFSAAMQRGEYGVEEADGPLPPDEPVRRLEVVSR